MRCHDLTMLCLNRSNITIITVKNVDYRFIIGNIRKFKATDLLKSGFILRTEVYIKNIILIFSLFKDFFLLFVFSMYKMVNIIDIYKFFNISIGIVMKNPGMLKLVPYHLKTKNMCKYELKNYLVY